MPETIKETTQNLKSFALIPGVEMGLISVDQLEKIIAAARNNNVDTLKITAGQRIGVLGVDTDTVNNIRKELGHGEIPAVPAGVKNIQVCPGETFCKYGRADTYGFGNKIKEALKERKSPGKVKIGISACPFNCSEAYLIDVGFIANKSGWTMVFGGASGSRPRIGDVVAQDLDEQAAIDLAVRYISYYDQEAKKKERPGRFADRIGIDAIKTALA